MVTLSNLNFSDQDANRRRALANVYRLLLLRLQEWQARQAASPEQPDPETSEAES